MNALRVALRSLVRRWSSTVTTIVVLGFSIGVTTAVFSVVDAVVLKPLPYPAADRLVTVMEANPAKAQRTSLVAPVRLEDWNRMNRTFEAISATYNENVTDTSEPEPRRLAVRRVAPRYFEVFGVPALVGRTLRPDEEIDGGPKSVVISEGLWTSRYGRNPAAIGRRLIFGGTGYTIVGVMPATFASAGIDVWEPAQIGVYLMRIREARFMSGVGRLKPGVTIAQALDDLARVQQALGEQYPASDKGWSATIVDLKESRVGDYRNALWLVFGAVGLLFAIAVANIAGLMLVQLHRRARELSIRQAIGGSRPQIVGAVMREVALTAVAGSVAGAILASWIVRLFATTFVTLPRVNELALDRRALAFSIAAGVVSTLVFGLLPVLLATRGDLARALAHGGRGASGARHRLQQTLVTSQIALSVLLLASAGLMLRSYYNLSHVDSGFDAGHAIVFHVGATWDEDRVRVGAMQERLVAALHQVPGVSAAGITSFLPAAGATLRYQVTLQGKATSDNGGKISVGVRNISGGYLQAIGLPLVAGESCPALRNDPAAMRSTLVNRAFADRYGPDVIGRVLTLDQNQGDRTIIGVVGNAIEDGPATAASPYLYLCLRGGFWPDPEYVVRTSGDPRSVMTAVRAVVHDIDAARAVFGVKTLEEATTGSLEQPRLNAAMVALFAAAALMLASLGLYSVLMLVVSERTRELGVRMALGASPLNVVGLVLAGAGRLLAGGAVIGLLLAVAASRLLRSGLFGVSALNGATLAGAVLALATAAFLAAALPAWRAAAIDPVKAIAAD